MTQKPPKLLLRIRVFLFCEVYILPLTLIKLTLIHSRDIHLFSGRAVWLPLSSSLLRTRSFLGGIIHPCTAQKPFQDLNTEEVKEYPYKEDYEEKCHTTNGSLFGISPPQKAMTPRADKATYNKRDHTFRPYVRATQHAANKK